MWALLNEDKNPSVIYSPKGPIPPDAIAVMITYEVPVKPKPVTRAELIELRDKGRLWEPTKDLVNRLLEAGLAEEKAVLNSFEEYNKMMFPKGKFITREALAEAWDSCAVTANKARISDTFSDLCKALKL